MSSLILGYLKARAPSIIVSDNVTEVCGEGVENFVARPGGSPMGCYQMCYGDTECGAFAYSRGMNICIFFYS